MPSRTPMPICGKDKERTLSSIAFLGEYEEKRSEHRPFCHDKKSGCSNPGSAIVFNKGVILLHVPADMTSEEPQNVNTVSFFMRLHKGHMLSCNQVSYI